MQISVVLAELLLIAPVLASPLAAHNLSAALSSAYFASDDLSGTFGLLPNVSWSSISTDLWELNSNSSDKLYSLFIIGRHGEGVHNLAESKYGSVAWDNYWSMKDGDGTLRWGPDANLTDLGEFQASRVHDRWLKEHTLGLPLPATLYSSPLSRALQTAQLSHGLSEEHSANLIVMENLRETIGVHTCDKRSTRSTILQRFPFTQLESHFSETDDLWKADHRESDYETQVRAYRALTRIMSNECALASKTDHNEHLLRVISVTSHSGFIRNMLTSLDHDAVRLPTAGILPLIIEATCTQEDDASIDVPAMKTVQEYDPPHDQLILSRLSKTRYDKSDSFRRL